MITDEKKQLVAFLSREAESKIQELVDQIESLQESRNSESKSTAGDKHEVGRAMVQTELDTLNKRLGELKERHSSIQNAEMAPSQKVVSGSLVQTNQATYFILIGVGKVVIDTTSYVVVSPASPIGQVLLGNKTGETATFRGNDMKILNIS